MRELTQVRVTRDKTEAVRIDDIAGRTVLRLKSWLPQHVKCETPIVFAGQELPLQVGATLPGAMRALCVGPGEWMIVSELQLPQVCDDGFALVDLTEGLAVFEVQGDAVRDLLSKGCGLDFHPRSFPAGHCARTRFARIPLIVECLDASPRFELYVARSYCHYLRSWLTDAATEFGDFVK